MLYANIHQLYCNRMQPEKFFYRHFFWTLSAINTTTDPKVLQPKSHNMKKKRCFVPIYISYTAIYCNRSIFSKSTPSGCFQHAKTPLIPNFGVLLHRVTLKSLTDWTISPFSPDSLSILQLIFAISLLLLFLPTHAHSLFQKTLSQHT